MSLQQVLCPQQQRREQRAAALAQRQRASQQQQPTIQQRRLLRRSRRGCVVLAPHRALQVRRLAIVRVAALRNPTSLEDSKRAVSVGALPPLLAEKAPSSYYVVPTHPRPRPPGT